jgi:hypothetical protein
MSFESSRARSHGWWKNLVEYGAWRGPGGVRVGPPDPEALDGIALLFGTTTDQVSEMVAADWYGVTRDSEVSTRVLRMGHLIDALDERDAELVEHLARRLAGT